jgi:hypothetical protein
MAGAKYELSVDAIALSAATIKSVLELATPAGQRARICEFWVEFDGVSASAVPVKCEFGRYSAAVTTATTVAGDKYDPADGTAVVIAKHSTSTEGAGTAVGTPLVHRIPPTSGYHYVSPPGSELILAVSTFWRMRLTAAAVVNATVGVIWEE